MSETKKFDKIVESALDELNKTYKKYRDTVDQVTKTSAQEWQQIGITPVRLSEEAIERNKETGKELCGQLMEAYSEEIQKIINDTTETLLDAKKDAVQKKVAAEPVPTDEQIRRVELLKTQYTHNGALNQIDLYNALKYHVENETVQAYPHYLLARETVGNDAERTKLLDDTYNRIFPEIAEKEAAVKEVEEAYRLFQIGVILFRFNTDDRLKMQEMNLESIRLKQQLYDLGYYEQNVVEHAS